MKRLIYAFDSPASGRDAVQVLIRAGVDKSNVSLIARSDIEMEKIPEDLQNASTDFVPALARGAAIGGIAGMVAGLVAMAIPPLGIAVGGAALIGFFTGGVLVGAWSSALVGASVPDEIRRKFEDEIKAGRVLLVVDASADNESLIAKTMATLVNHHLLWQSDIEAEPAL